MFSNDPNKKILEAIARVHAKPCHEFTNEEAEDLAKAAPAKKPEPGWGRVPSLAKVVRPLVKKIHGWQCPDPDCGGHVEKRDFSDKERQHLAGTGAALPDGSHPIVNETDLHNAIQAYGRNATAKVKAHIIARAKALGETSMLPDDWKEDSSKSVFAGMSAIDPGTQAGAAKLAADAINKMIVGGMGKDPLSDPNFHGSLGGD